MSAPLEPKRRGRPPLPAGESKAERFELRLSGAQWLRERIDAAT